jgi:anti-sigma regulatory factor (Ser/Thr protein kinase)
MRAVETLQTFALKQGVPEKMIFGLALALEECGSNIVNHALKRDAGRTFSVAFDRNGDTFFIELRDAGPEFDPTTAPVRPPRAEDDDVPGGWGIELVRRNLDAMRYQREGNENVLRLTRRLGGATDPKPIS